MKILEKKLKESEKEKDKLVNLNKGIESKLKILQEEKDDIEWIS